MLMQRQCVFTQRLHLEFNLHVRGSMHSRGTRFIKLHYWKIFTINVKNVGRAFVKSLLGLSDKPTLQVLTLIPPTVSVLFIMLHTHAEVVKYIPFHHGGKPSFHSKILVIYSQIITCTFLNPNYK